MAMPRPIRFRTDYARWPRALPRNGARFDSDTADRLIGLLCGAGLVVVVVLAILGVA